MINGSTQCLECGEIVFIHAGHTTSMTCHACTEFMSNRDHRTIDRLERLLKKSDMRAQHCGLNGDWSVAALCVSPSGEANMDEGLMYVLDDEDGFPDGNLVLVRRYYERTDESGNDHIEEVYQTADPRLMAAIIRREIRRNPPVAS